MYNFNMSKRRKGWFKRRLRFNLKTESVFSIVYILLFFLAFLIILSFTRQGFFLFNLNLFLINLFGWGVVFLVFFLVLGGLMLTKFNVPWNQVSVIAGGILMSVSLMGITRSGVVGGEIFNQIAFLLTPIGSYVILFCGSLVGFVVFFNTPFDQVVLFFSGAIKGFLSIFSGMKKSKPQFIQEKMISRPIARHELSREQAKAAAASEEEFIGPASNIPGAQSEVWNYPPISLLSEVGGGKADRGDVKDNAQIIEKTFDSFGVSAHVVEFNEGPAVTQYAIEVALGTKLSKITGLSNDLALALAAPTGQIRIEAPIPGRSLVGIELPNRSAETVTLRQILSSEQMKGPKNKLFVPLGLDVSGQPKIGNIAKMPHVLIAGQTGSGKSVLLNSWIASFLFRTTPSELRLILIDPKRVEFTQYANVPHLMTPVIVEPEKVIKALKWATTEMENRYKAFAQVGARNIEMYNELSGFQALPNIIIIIDELADVIMFAPAEVEDNICRLAQMARATGIHLVIATQRPSVDVLTGLIKANIPTRISFAVSSMVDSRVILDSPGAEKLLGRGDMLFIPPDQAKPSRIQGAFVSELEIQKLMSFFDKSGIRPVYTDAVLETSVSSFGRSGDRGGHDSFFDEAVHIVCQSGKASSSLLQRRLSVGYARAARILDQLEEAGVVGPSDGSKPRDILIKNPEEILSPNQE